MIENVDLRARWHDPGLTPRVRIPPTSTLIEPPSRRRQASQAAAGQQVQPLPVNEDGATDVVGTEQSQPFFTESGTTLTPAPHARGPWAPKMMHGRLLGGLLARAVEREQTTPGLHVTRLTVDLFRSAAMEPLQISTTRIRDGRRIRVVEATVNTANGPVAQANAVLLRTSEQPVGHVPTTPQWNTPTPDELGPAPEAGWRPQWDTWVLDEDGTPTRGWDRTYRRAWLRETHSLVSGEQLTPLVRATLAADFSSPIAHAGSAGLQYINVDYTLTLSRLPIGEAIGLESGGHLNTDGIAVGHCTMHDTSGPIGYCMVSAIANPNHGFT